MLKAIVKWILGLVDFEVTLDGGVVTIIIKLGKNVVFEKSFDFNHMSKSQNTLYLKKGG